MKNKLFILITLPLILMISACGNNAAHNQDVPVSAVETIETFTYQSEIGPVEIPLNPTRIVALTNAPNVFSLGGTLVGVDEWTMMNPLFSEELAGIEVVSEANLEKITALEPDLIILGTHMSNIEEIRKIAPTVAFTWGKLDYLAQQLEIGKILNKEKEAQEWIDDFKQRAEAIGKEIKARFGEDLTVSVFETDAKNFYVFGNAWARGTEILYQAMDLNMTEKVKQDALSPGYYMLSQEVIPDYAGDFIVLSRGSTADNTFMASNIWLNIPAVQNKRVIEINTESSTYSDPITLEYLLDIFKEGFLGSM